MTVHSFARSKLPRQNMMNNVTLFSRDRQLGQLFIQHRKSTNFLILRLTARQYR